ncbi:MAG: diguanylate cyclase [Gammaproteobacteria bacterium]|nr:MAG: diguanylate cyclase [Gammaproteobacteria bacterium]
MEYTESLERSAEITRMVLPTLSRLGLPVNPINYALFYEYFLGRNPRLKEALEPVVENGGSLSPDRAKELFEEQVVFANTDRVEKIGEEIREMLGKIIQMISDAGGDVSHFSGSLGAYAHSLEHLDEANAAQQLKSLVGQMLTEARQMVESNREFGQKLDATSREIGALRAELADLRLQATLDALTGLGNRKTFDEALARALEQAPGDMATVCLMMVDIDNFKSINDEYGHLIGDKILRFVAETLRRSVKGRDVVARFGGDEFGVVLEETPPQGAYRLAENIRQTIEKSALKRTDTGEPIRNITVSIGVECNRPGDRPDDLIERADQALYESKNKGRNRVTCGFRG